MVRAVFPLARTRLRPSLGDMERMGSVQRTSPLEGTGG